MNGHPDQAGSRLDRATFQLALLQCILQPISHVTALENLTFYTMLACVFALTWFRRETLSIRTPIVASVLALTTFFIVVSILGPYPLESLNAWRKDFLPPLATFMALLLTVRSPQRTVAVLMAVIAGLAIRLTLIAIEVWILQQPLISGHPGFVRPYTGSVVPSAFFGGFAVGAAIYAPLIAASLLRRDLPVWGRYMAVYSLVGCILLVVDYGSRTPLLAMCAGLAVVVVATLGRRTIIASGLVVLVVVSLLSWHRPEVAERYGSIFAARTYTDAAPGQGTTIGDRLRIWDGIIEIANQRPLAGYGYGWKKLSMVVRDDGFLDRWKDSPDADGFTVAYFSLGYGGINPHNLLVHLYFEGGVFGVALFAVMLGVFVQGCWQLWRRPAGEDRTLGIIAGSFAVTWMVANVGNSIWAGEKLPFVAMALVGATLWRAAGVQSIPRSILVIRRDNIGDLLCTTPLITALRHRYPDAWIGALTNSYAAPALAGNPDLDEVLVYEKGKHLASPGARLRALAYRVALIAGLRRRHIDVALLPASGDQRSAERFAALSGAARVIRADDMPAAGPHEVEMSFRCATSLGIEGPPPRMTLLAPPAAAVQVPAGDGPVVGLHISARKVPQRWPIERFAELARRLHAEDGSRFLLFWAPGAADDAKHPGDDAKAIDLAEQMRGLPFAAVPTHHLSELIAGLSNCDRVV
jgi:ADP-heptose:LPS heptosyltransferase/O-antigen ligase